MAQARDRGLVVRFLLAGGPGVLLYYFTLWSLTDLLGVWYVLSAVPAFVVNWISNFFIQKYWTFKNRDRANRRRQAGQHFLLAVGMLLGNLALLYVLTNYAGLWYLASQAIATVLLTIVSYCVSKRIFPPDAA